jgi:hypothetical protein
MKFSRRTGLAQYENDIQSQKPRIEGRRRIHRFASEPQIAATDSTEQYEPQITQINTDVGDLCWRPI